MKYAVLIEFQKAQATRVYSTLDEACRAKQRADGLGRYVPGDPKPRVRIFAGTQVLPDDVETYLPAAGDKYLVMMRTDLPNSPQWFDILDSFPEACAVIGTVVDTAEGDEVLEEHIRIALLAGAFVESLEEPLDQGDDQRAEQLDQQ